MNHWLIMTKDGIYVMGVFHGSHEEAIEHCYPIYGNEYALAEDNRNDNHPFWQKYHREHGNSKALK